MGGNLGQTWGLAGISKSTDWPFAGHNCTHVGMGKGHGCMHARGKGAEKSTPLCSCVAEGTGISLKPIP